MYQAEYEAEYEHKHIKGMTCQKVEETKNGWKVLQQDTPKKKPKTQFYHAIYFSNDKGVWQKITIKN